MVRAGPGCPAPRELSGACCREPQTQGPGRLLRGAFRSLWNGWGWKMHSPGGLGPRPSPRATTRRLCRLQSAPKRVVCGGIRYREEADCIIFIVWNVNTSQATYLRYHGAGAAVMEASSSDGRPPAAHPAGHTMRGTCCRPNPPRPASCTCRWHARRELIAKRGRPCIVRHHGCERARATSPHVPHGAARTASSPLGLSPRHWDGGGESSWDTHLPGAGHAQGPLGGTPWRGQVLRLWGGPPTNDIGHGKETAPSSFNTHQANAS